MAPIVILSFQDTDASGNTFWTYQAYSSNDPSRSRNRLLREVFIHVGYQLCNTEDNATRFGRLMHYHADTCEHSLGDRSQGIYFVRNDDHSVDGDHHIVARDYRSVLVDAEAEEERIMLCEHYIAPEFANLPGYESGSDTEDE
jgi:hypothetical protein